MSQQVTTAYGPGVVVASETVRGHTSFKVEGNGFSVWLEAAQIPEFGQLEWDFDPASVNRDNSTTLPYNPQPQVLPHNGESTIQPNQHLNPEKRTSPADSLTFQERGEEDRFPRNFAGNIHEAGDQDGTDVEHDFEYPTTTIDEDYPGGTNTPADHSAPELQARLGDKYVDIPRDVDYFSLQAQLDNDPYRVVSDIKVANYEKRQGLDERVAQQMDLEKADPQIREAAWSDVRAKATRIRRSGGVQLEAANPTAIVATVTGDHGIYDVAVIRGSALTGASSVTDWTCSCPWGDWAFERQHTFVGRLCSHAYAALQELRSLTMRKEKPRDWSHKASVEASVDPVTLDEWENWKSSHPDGTVDEFDDEWPQNPEDLEDLRSHVGAVVEAAQYPREDGRLTTERGTLEPDMRYIPQTHERRRTDLEDMDPYDGRLAAETQAFLSEPFQGSGPDNFESFGTSAEYTRGHDLEDLNEDKGNPVSPNEGDVRMAYYDEDEEDGHGRQSAREVTARDADSLASAAEAAGWEVDVTTDWSGAATRSTLRKGDLIIGVEYGGALAGDRVSKAFLSEQDPLGWAGAGIAEGSDLQTVLGWISGGVTAALPDNGLNEDGTDAPEEVDVEDPDDIVAQFQKNAGYLLEGGETTGAVDDDLASNAEAFLRTAGRNFTLAEQQELMDEEAQGGGIPLDDLDLRGTHYRQ